MEWGDSMLAQSAREVLIKSIAQSVPTGGLGPYMGVFKLPASVCVDLNRSIHNYWWGSANVGWPKLLQSKLQGSMGFRDMCIFNQALLARQDMHGN
jgi:hypothetical protein